MRAWCAVVRRDLMIAGRRISDVCAVVMFFVLAVVLFPLGVSLQLCVSLQLLSFSSLLAFAFLRRMRLWRGSVRRWQRHTKGNILYVTESTFV